MIDFGLTPEQFCERHLEHEPLLKRLALRTCRFTWRDLYHALHVVEPAAPAFQVFNNGPIAEEHFTDRVVEFGVPRRRLNKRRFYDQLRHGATLVLNRFESCSPPALTLVSSVAGFTGWQALGNAYLSLGGRGTFGRHWDTHDVFAIQLMGRKRWRLYAPTFALPLSGQRSDGSGHRCPETPVLDCVLETGDLLYVPRGWWHEALPFDEPSLHLSVGTYAPTVHDYLLWAVARHLPAVAAARRTLTGTSKPEDLAAALAGLATIVQDAERLAEFERELALRHRARSGFDTELQLSAGMAALDGATAMLAHATPPTTNGSRAPLSPAASALVAVLGDGPLPLEALYERVAHVPRGDVQTALLDLEQSDVIAIVRAR